MVDLPKNSTMYFFGLMMDHMKEIIRECAFPTNFGSNVALNPRIYCKDCVVETDSPIRAWSVINPQLHEPPILSFYNATQIELLNTIIPHYEEQTQELLGVKRQWLTDLPNSGYLGANHADLDVEAISSLLGISVDG